MKQNSYLDWKNRQITDYGQIEKTKRGRLGQLHALKAFEYFFQDSHVLDFGCGSGAGMLFLYALGAKQVDGFDINPEKIYVANKVFGLDAFLMDDLEYYERDPGLKYDVVWCSHTFEHVYDPEQSLERIKSWIHDDGIVIFVVPYPDTGTPRAHVASEQLGLYVEDGGDTFATWLEDRGMNIYRIEQSDVREKELWISAKKDKLK